jgi:hypothetical protein
MFRCFATALPAAVAASMLSATCAAAPPPIDAFARSPAMRSPSISPNGALIAFISGVGDRSVVFVSKRGSTEPAKAIFGADSDKFDLSWCNWANDTRLLCGLEGMSVDVGHVFPITRLVGVNADGSGLKVLMQRTTSTQFEDSILDWTPDEPDTVLIQLDDDEDGFPSVFELNVMSGRIGVRVHQQKPIRAFVTDAKGNVRFATGTQRDKLREDSPLRHVDTINMPVLLVHGDRDYQVDVDHSRRMNAALKKAGKPHRAVIIPNATHQLQRQSERITLLTEVEKFLLDNLGPGATPTP